MAVNVEAEVEMVVVRICGGVAAMRGNHRKRCPRAKAEFAEKA